MSASGKPSKPFKPKFPSKYVDWEFRMDIYGDVYIFREDFLKFIENNIYIPKKDVAIQYITDNLDKLKFEVDDYDGSTLLMSITLPAELELVENISYTTQLSRYNKNIETYDARLATYEEKFKAWKIKDVDACKALKEKKLAKARKLLKEAGEL